MPALAKIEIRNSETGEVREVTDNELLHYNHRDFPPFIWEEGNYSCDCNLHIFFEGAGNPAPPVAESFGFPCDGNRYRVKLTSASGEIWADHWGE